MQQINDCGIRGRRPAIPGTTYWDYNWRKRGGSQRMIENQQAREFSTSRNTAALHLFVCATPTATVFRPAASASRSACSFNGGDRGEKGVAASRLDD